MSDNNNPSDGGIDPNTVRELERARADLKSLRAEMTAIRGERDAATKERDDAIKSRDGYKGQIEKQKAEYEQRIAGLTEAEAAAKSSAEKALADVKTASDAAVIRAEAKAAATRAGAQNPDDVVRLIDLSSVSIGEDGTIAGLDEVISGAREAKSYLFTEPAKPGATTGNTTSQPAPKPAPPGDFDARTASADEVKARMKAMGLRQPRNTGA